MACRRMVIPSIWDDEDIGALSHGAFRLYIACISNADDDGRLLGGAKRLKGLVFRFCDVTTADVAGWLEELSTSIRSFITYDVDGREYIQLGNWHKYQSIPKAHYTPSTLPPPPAGTEVVQYKYSTGTVRVQDEYSTDTVRVQPKTKQNKVNLTPPLPPSEGERADGDTHFRYLAQLFRKRFPSPKQGTVEKTITCMASEYTQYGGDEIEARIYEHSAAGTKDLAPWELFSREPGSAPTEAKKQPRRRTAEDLEYFDIHGHMPEDSEAASRCCVCTKEQNR